LVGAARLAQAARVAESALATRASPRDTPDHSSAQAAGVAAQPLEADGTPTGAVRGRPRDLRLRGRCPVAAVRAVATLSAGACRPWPGTRTGDPARDARVHVPPSDTVPRPQPG